MSRFANREPIAKVDTAWLRMEQPTNLMMITGVVTLANPITYERLLDTIETRWLAAAWQGRPGRTGGVCQ